MDRDGNLPGFFRKCDDSGSWLGQEDAIIKPRGGFDFTLVTATLFQAWAFRPCAVRIAAKG